MKLDAAKFLRTATVGTALAVILPACDKTPDGILPPDEMASLLVDLHKGEGIVELDRARFYNDSLRKTVKQSVLRAHGVTAADLDSSFMWYGNHLEVYLKVYDDVIARLEKEMADAGASAAAKIYASGDSVDLWGLSPTYRLRTGLPANTLAFSLDVDDTSEPGDNYQLQFKVVNPRTISPGVQATVLAAYEEDVEWVSEAAKTDGWTRVRLVTDSARPYSNIFLTLDFDIPHGFETVWLDSISLVRTRRSPSQYWQRNLQHKL